MQHWPVYSMTIRLTRTQYHTINARVNYRNCPVLALGIIFQIRGTKRSTIFFPYENISAIGTGLCNFLLWTSASFWDFRWIIFVRTVLRSDLWLNQTVVAIFDVAIAISFPLLPFSVSVYVLQDCRCIHVRYPSLHPVRARDSSFLFYFAEMV